MANLQRYENDGIELLIDQETGEVFSSIAGYARMSGKSRGTIQERLKGMPENLTKMAEVFAGTRVQCVRLIPENIITEWIIKDNPELANQMMKTY